MLTIEVELLTGRYAATAYNDRSRAEWPPHPARFFSALVAALHEHEPEDAAEREALLWLERLKPPSLEVDLAANHRQVHDVFVPVNDVTLVGDPEKGLREAQSKRAALSSGSAKELKSADKAVAKEEQKLAAFIAAQQMTAAQPSQSDLQKAAALLPERRTRQMRTFPVVLPEKPVFTFNWEIDLPPAHAKALAMLCARVTRLGHSSSLVRCVVVDRKPDVNLVPHPRGDHVLRTVGPGQLEQLEEAYRHHRGIDQRTLPSRPERYGSPDNEEKDIPCSIFSDDWIIFQRHGGARLLSSRTADLCKALRASLIEQANRKLPPSLSGHLPNGERANVPHIAFIAPPFVGREHADGTIQGCAIVLPHDLSAEDRQTLLKTIADWEKKPGNRNGVVALGVSNLQGHFEMKRPVDAPPFSLMERRWCQPARRFVTATPIALDKNPGNLRSNQGRTAAKAAAEAQQFVADACVNIGLPRPIAVEISLAPLLPGAQPVSAFAPWPRVPGRPPRVRVHADIRFAENVSGPMLLGAGRYMGLGLCLPVPEAR